MPVEITITMDDNGAVNIAGPLDNPIMMYGLLQIACDTTKDHNAKKRDSGIVTAPAGFHLMPGGRT